MTMRGAIAQMLLGAFLMAPSVGASGQETAAQDGAAMREQFAGMQRVGGEVTAIAGGALTIKTETGATMTIVTTDNTRVMKGRPNEGGGAVKVGELKVGDGVMAVGNLDAANRTLHAALVMATDAAALKALKENLGKTYIAGKVTGIDLDGATMTVLRGDGVSQTIGLDEGTSFRRGRAGMMPGGEGGGAGRARSEGAPAESITLADVKVGDNVAGRGALKGGVFVPTELAVQTPGQRRARQGGAVAAAPQ